VIRIRLSLRPGGQLLTGILVEVRADLRRRQRLATRRQKADVLRGELVVDA